MAVAGKKTRRQMAAVEQALRRVRLARPDALLRRCALRLAASLAAGDESGLDRFFIEILGWRREPTADERAAARTVLLRGRRWRDPWQIDGQDLPKYIARAIVKTMIRARRRPRYKREGGRRGGRAADAAVIRRRVGMLLAVSGLPRAQQAILRALARGSPPCEAVSQADAEWGDYRALMRRARRLEAMPKPLQGAIPPGPRLVKRAAPTAQLPNCSP